MRYDNTKVQALLDGHISVDSSWTAADFAALAVAAADQAGATVEQQEAISAELPDCPHEDCDQHLGHGGRHTHRCDDGGCCEPTDQDLEDAAERIDYARERQHA